MSTSINWTFHVMEWIRLEKRDVTHPTPFSILYKEYQPATNTPLAMRNLRSCVRIKVKKLARSFGKWTPIERCQLHFLLGFPVTEWVKEQLETLGTLQLDQYDRIIYFRSNDGEYERQGVHSNAGITRRYRKNREEGEMDTSTMDDIDVENDDDDILVVEEDLYDVPEEGLGVQMVVPVKQEEVRTPDFASIMAMIQPKIEPPQIMAPVKKSEQESIPSTSILRNFDLLIMVFDFPALHSLKQKIQEELCNPGRQGTMIPLDEFSFSVDHCLRILFKGASTQLDPSKPDVMRLIDFLRPFALQLMNLGIEKESRPIKQLLGEIQACNQLREPKMIPIQKVVAVLDTLFEVATPAL